MLQATRASSSNNSVLSSVFFLFSKIYLCLALSLPRGRLSMESADIAGCWTIGSISDEEERTLSGLVCSC